MDDFLTSRQVQNILKVDRITVYRMLQDGRLKGVKIGQQWRFPRSEVERMVGGSPQPASPAQDPESPFPTHCVQTIQDLFSDVGQIGAVVVDSSGAAVTELSRPCAFCQLILASPSGRRACGASWENVAQNCTAGSKYFTCHAGLQYVAAPIQDRGQRVAPSWRASSTGSPPIPVSRPSASAAWPRRTASRRLIWPRLLKKLPSSRRINTFAPKPGRSRPRGRWKASCANAPALWNV